MKPKKFQPAIFYISIMLLVSTGIRAQAEDKQRLAEDKQRLINLEKRRFDAMVRRDTTLLKGFLADSLVYIHSSGIIDNKISFLKDLSSGHITYLFIYPEKVTAVVDGNYGWIYGRANIRFKLSTMTTTIDQYVSFVEVFYLKRSQWQMVLCHNARVEKNAPYFDNTVPQVKSGSIPSIY